MQHLAKLNDTDGNKYIYILSCICVRIYLQETFQMVLNTSQDCNCIMFAIAISQIANERHVFEPFCIYTNRMKDQNEKLCQPIGIVCRVGKGNEGRNKRFHLLSCQLDDKNTKFFWFIDNHFFFSCNYFGRFGLWVKLRNACRIRWQCWLRDGVCSSYRAHSVFVFYIYVDYPHSIYRFRFC